MTIDAHTHLGGFPPVEKINAELTTRVGVAGWRSKHPDVYEAVQNTEPTDNADALIEAMDRYDISASIVQPTVGVSNEALLSMAARYPDRLVPLAWVAPFRWDGEWKHEEDATNGSSTPDAIAAAAAEALRQGFAGIGESATRGITKEVDPVLIARDLGGLMEVLSERGDPIQFPTGWTQFPGNLYYQDPLWVDELAGRYPKVPIILTKMGRGLQRFFDSVLAVALRNRNVYLDIVATTPAHLSVAIDLLGPERIMYGTDWTYTWRYLSQPYDAHTASRITVTEATQDPGAQRAILEETASRVFARGLGNLYAKRSTNEKDS